MGAAASLMARLRTPHCTVAVRARRSTCTIWLNLARLSVTPIALRQCAAAQAGAGTARHHRHLQPVAGLQHTGHLGLGFGQGHGQRHLTVGGQAITFVGDGVLAVPQQCVRRQQGAQRGHHLGLAGGASGGTDCSQGRGHFRRIHGLVSSGTAANLRCEGGLYDAPAAPRLKSGS
jgi:hypothetical protein